MGNKTKQPDGRTRRVILETLKRDGAQTAHALAEFLEMTSMAVRQHLYALQDQKLVAFDERQTGKGRPAKYWRLTEEADRLFPHGYGDLTVDLLSSMSSVFGAKGLERLLAHRTEQQIAAYRRQMPARGSLRHRLEKLAAIRTEEGYMAQVERCDDGSYLLIENHCPICFAARSCVGLCGSELTVFQQVLGDDIAIERTEHIVEGARRCVYRVRRASESGRKRRNPAASSRRQN